MYQAVEKVTTTTTATRTIVGMADLEVFLHYYFLVTIPCFLYMLLVSSINCILNKVTVVELLQDGPLVSVLVPARNEAHHIGELLRSLCNQTYANYEIIVLDDNSSDLTLETASAMALTDHRIKVLQGQPLPDTWYGKSFAMQQLYEQSNGTILLFTDADTVHGIDSISFMVSSLFHHDCQLVSGYPSQSIQSFGELISVPCIFGVKIFLPFFLIKLIKYYRISFAIGQYMCVTRSALRAVDGFDRMRDVVCEDLQLAKHIKRCGLRTSVVSAHRYVTCRMYKSYGEAFIGLAKLVFPSLGYSYLGALATVLFVLMTIFPLALIVCDLIAYHRWNLEATASVAVFTTAWAVALWDEGLLFLIALLYPFHMLSSLAMLIYSVFAIKFGRGVEWKGRRVR